MCVKCFILLLSYFTYLLPSFLSSPLFTCCIHAYIFSKRNFRHAWIKACNKKRWNWVLWIWMYMWEFVHIVDFLSFRSVGKGEENPFMSYCWWVVHRKKRSELTLPRKLWNFYEMSLLFWAFTHTKKSSVKMYFHWTCD